MNSVSELCEAIWSLERKYNLNQWRVSNVYVWPLLRMRLYYLAAIKSGIFQEPHLNDQRNTFTQKAKVAASIFYHSFFRNPFLAKVGKRYDAIVFEHERSALMNGQQRCIYTEQLKRQLTGNGQSYISLDRAFAGLHLKNRVQGEDVLYLDFIYLTGKLLAAFMPTPRLDNNDKAIIAALQLNLGSDIDIHAEIVRARSRFVALRWLFKKLIKRFEAKTLYAVVAYGFHDLCAAASECGAKVVELQHGVISRYHLGYSYPHWRAELGAPPYFPDQIYTWGNTWVLSCPFPLATNAVREGLVVWPQLPQLEKYRTVKKDPYLWLVLSQGALGEAMIKAIWDALPHIPEAVRLIYKTHPSEITKYTRYAYYSRLKESGRVEFMDAGDLYAVLASASVAVGVFSTALIEAKELGCRVIALDLPGREYLENEEWVTKWEQFVSEEQRGEA